MKRLDWDVPDAPPSRRPIRDTLLVYGALSVVIVLFAWVTGGPVLKAVGVAVLFFAVACAWNLFRLYAARRRRD